MSFTVRFRSYSVGTHSGTPLHRLIDPDHGILKRRLSPEQRDGHKHRRCSSHAGHDADYAYPKLTRSAPRRSSVSSDTKTTTILNSSGPVWELDSTRRGVGSREEKNIQTSRPRYRVPDDLVEAHNQRTGKFSGDIGRTSAHTPHNQGVRSKPSVAVSPGFVTLHPYLTDTLLRWDIKYPPSSATYINAFAGSPGFTLDVHATFPITSQIVLQLKHLSVPGCGTLVVSFSSGITVRHVLDAVYATFNKPLDFGDYAHMGLEQYMSFMKAYKRRRVEMGLPFSQALRLDILVGRTSFLGLSLVDPGNEESSKVKLLLA